MGPTQKPTSAGRTAELKPQYLEDTLVFLFETRLPIRPTRFALETELLERDYYTHWQGLKKNFGDTIRTLIGSRLCAFGSGSRLGVGSWILGVVDQQL